MNIDLSDDETSALKRLLRKAIDDDRYPLSPRIQTLQRILDRLDPPSVREVPRPMSRREQNRASAEANGNIRVRLP